MAIGSEPEGMLFRITSTQAARPCEFVVNCSVNCRPYGEHQGWMRLGFAMKESHA